MNWTDIANPQGGVPDLSQVPTHDLKRELAAAIGITAKGIARVAVIWAELTRRGEDLSGIQFALRDYMGAVARGELLPEVVATLAGRVRVLSAVAAMPTSEQRRLLIDGEAIEIVTPGGVARKRVADMTFAEVSRAIRNGKVVAPDGQSKQPPRPPVDRDEADAASKRAAAKVRGSRAARRITIDGDVAWVGVSRASVCDIIAALEEAGWSVTRADIPGVRGRS